MKSETSVMQSQFNDPHHPAMLPKKKDTMPFLSIPTLKYIKFLRHPQRSYSPRKWDSSAENELEFDSCLFNMATLSYVTYQST